ncbi:hypothetical protein P8891_06265 [Bacillus atrophaeus]|uniref:hypothetical protein n=1 Tax=Bacillus atrophaeus TaxID=1452 RepID=UPI00227E594B|nr:hypothetical protein [Bacillus atrophaeus]MCY7948016.1 hypothetical protein [Bacillus atrophaeus]MCY8098039.1 hypothetical protein [Bacillus atrophaeus]MCY9169963.1 hypothetical protein [Bacillus atrophaeus]MEC0740688.1 hypothetical protein [Bacillus atrophaeus]MEC0747048.1 hypothetical protein [Bacillus atrophaeus]
MAEKASTKQAIESNTQRISHVQSFLNELPLNTDMDKTVALELSTIIAFIEEDTRKLKEII